MGGVPILGERAVRIEKIILSSLANVSMFFAAILAVKPKKFHRANFAEAFWGRR